MATAICLSCSSFDLDGTGWEAWTRFEPEGETFCYSSGTTHPDLADASDFEGHRRAELNWRSACEVLLDSTQDELWFDARPSGDFRSDVRVSGSSDWRADLLALCWIQDDVSEEVKLFLIRIPDEDLEWLDERMDGGVASDASLEWLNEFLAYDDTSPRVRWLESFRAEEEFDFSLLLQKVQLDHLEREDARLFERAAALAPFKETLNRLIAEHSALLPETSSQWGGLARGQNVRSFATELEEYVLANSSLPKPATLKSLWETACQAPFRWGPH